MSTAPPWSYVLTPRATRDMRQLDPTARRRVFDALDRLVQNPLGGQLRKLEGGDSEWRLRVGNWRVRCALDVAARTVVVLRVLPRGRAYRE